MFPKDDLMYEVGSCEVVTQSTTKFTGKNQKHAQNYNVVSGRLREFDDNDKFPLQSQSEEDWWGGGEDILVFCPLTKGRRLRVTGSKRRFSEIGSRFTVTEAIRFHKKYILRCLKTVSSTFQYIHFDGSLQPVLRLSLHMS